MKLNNKGFAITAVLYGLLILFVILVSGYLTVLTLRKNRIDNLIEDIEKEYIEISNPLYVVTLYYQGTASEFFRTEIFFCNKKWYSDSSKTERIRKVTITNSSPILEFKGYYTETNGKGTQIINEEGEIISNNITSDTSLYAYWKEPSSGGGGFVTE